MATCPWCGFAADDETYVQLHIEERHVEDSPFVVQSHGKQKHNQTYPAPSSNRQIASTSSTDVPVRWTRCTRTGCGEHVALEDADEHLRMHELLQQHDHRPRDVAGLSKLPELSSKARIMTKPQPTKRMASSQRGSTTGTKESKSRTILSYFAGSSQPKQTRGKLIPRSKEPGRLGKRDLGPHAFEHAMPTRVRRVLEDAAYPVTDNHINSSGRLVRVSHFPNETASLIPVIARLASLDGHMTTYCCDESVKHIHRIQCDGNFCGYWNIQMMISYLEAQRDRPRAHLPTVLEIQDTIEKAWSDGLYAYGKTETGGIYNTRKWIGTSEAAAFFWQQNIPVEAMSFQDNADAQEVAHLSLLDYVESYFHVELEDAPEDLSGCVVLTKRGPIYLQRAGHSVTIVGIQRHKKGERSLLVFDSSFATNSAMLRLVDGRSASSPPETLLNAYRLSQEKLARWKEFEILTVHPT